MNSRSAIATSRTPLRSSRRAWRAIALLVGALSLMLAGTGSAGATDVHALIEGSGSSWSSNAVNQWIADVQNSGLRVVYTASGSAIGRKDFAFKTTDFAVSDIGYQGVDPITHDTDSSGGRAFAYLPIVAGGTAFPYQVRVAGQLRRNIRLSGTTIAKIFTNQITNWDDKAITADNNGSVLPSLTIIPVVHSEGSGSTAQFTRYLDTEFPSIWRPFQGQAGLTEYYPRKGQMISQSGSDGVMNFVASSAGNGAIGYDEYSYALGKNYPVVKVLNKAGYFTLPNQYNVAVALTKAIINEDKTSPNYLLQNLDNVYADADVRTYPLSSYSYMIIPTASSDSRMTTAKRQTLSDFLFYSVCQGQAEMGPIGYSPLPVNLVQASFSQVAKLKTADPGVDLTKRDVTTCHNPTFVAGQPTRNYLAEIAPKPPACDKTGAGPCTGSGNDGTHGTGGGGSASPTPSATSSASPGTTPGSSIDPGTGQVVSAADPNAGGGGDAVAVPSELAVSTSSSVAPVLAPLAVLVLLLVLVLPPWLSRRLAARPKEGA